MAWSEDRLLLMPQYPGFGGKSPRLFMLTRSQLETAIQSGGLAPLNPTPVAFSSGNLEQQLEGFEGYEALVVKQNSVYLTIEKQVGPVMGAYVVRGTFDPSIPAIRLDPASLTQLDMVRQIDNASYEAMLLDDKSLVLLHEGNGVNQSPPPVALRLSLDLTQSSRIPMAQLEYRLTEATEPDISGKFWVINYSFPGSARAYSPGEDGLVTSFGNGVSHRQHRQVERLVELQLTPQGIVHSGRQPIFLSLDGDVARNWEGLVRWNDQGFLAITDKFPTTVLAYIPAP